MIIRSGLIWSLWWPYPPPPHQPPPHPLPQNPQAFTFVWKTSYCLVVDLRVPLVPFPFFFLGLRKGCDGGGDSFWVAELIFRVSLLIVWLVNGEGIRMIRSVSVYVLRQI